MILMRENPLQGQLEGVGSENGDFLGPEMATSEVCINLRKVFQGLFAEK
jgi:hypothetical protein